MPVSIATKNDPLRGVRPAETAPHALRVPQARVLRALMPVRADDDPEDWPYLTRVALCYRAGYTTLSGSITRALNGIREGNTTSGDPHKGLIALGYVEVVMLDVMGLMEQGYTITAAGADAYRAYVATTGGLPPVKDGALCVNDRYLPPEE